MNIRIAYSLSAVFLLLATTIGVLAVTTSAPAVDGDHCVWTWYREDPEDPWEITDITCMPFVPPGDCISACTDEADLCQDDCLALPENQNQCQAECSHVYSKCRGKCRPAPK
jgi:hypothetical protein